jgi:hypothetical protein
VLDDVQLRHHPDRLFSLVHNGHAPEPLLDHDLEQFAEPEIGIRADDVTSHDIGDRDLVGAGAASVAVFSSALRDRFGSALDDSAGTMNAKCAVRHSSSSSSSFSHAGSSDRSMSRGFGHEPAVKLDESCGAADDPLETLATASVASTLRKASKIRAVPARPICLAIHV